MHLDEPRWWYAPRPNAIALLLMPAAVLWDWVTRLRFWRTRTVQCGLPVICIGNFTAGGSGKTPFAILVAEHLLAQGQAPYFLTRGYGGTFQGPHVVDIERDTAQEVGDEALLLARIAPTVVSRDRVKGAARIVALARRQPADGVIIMDDGLQNPSLHRDLSLALVDARRGIGNGCVIPAGPLRASLKFQRSMVDGLVVLYLDSPGEAVAEAGKSIAADVGISAKPMVAWTEPRGDTAWLRDRKVVAYAGIANPTRFYDMLEVLGARCQATVSFPDHHVFTQLDAQALLDRADQSDAELVTTEKDWVRLAGASGELKTLRDRSRVLEIVTRLSVDGLVDLAGRIDKVLARDGLPNGCGASRRIP